MKPKPPHLGPRYAAQFQDGSVARAYSTRPPYAPEFFDVLESLMPDGDRSVLDLGCGTGEVAIGLSDRVDRIDAVDPSVAMLEIARGRVAAKRAEIHWYATTAERFTYAGPYDLVVAGESLHWMEWSTVLPKIADALGSDAFLALAVGREIRNVPWSGELATLIPRYSTNQEFRAYDLLSELTSRGLFREIGRHVTQALTYCQSVDHYVESTHTRNGFSRDRMTIPAAREFDRAVRALVSPCSNDGDISGEISTSIVWGRPVPESQTERA